MPPYLFPSASTAPLPSFSELLLDPSAAQSSSTPSAYSGSGRYSAELSDATAARSRLREILKDLNAGGNGKDGVGKDWISLSRSSEEYLPYLEAMMDCLESDELLVKQEPNFQWQSMVNASSFPGTSSMVSLPTYHSELLFVTIIYATSLSNSAATILNSGGPLTPSNVISSADEKRKNDRLSAAADLLCRSSGVFEYAAEKMIPAWEAGMRASSSTVGGSGGKWKGKGRMPGECSRDVIKGLSLMALADAQSLAVQKLIAPYDPSSTMLPFGPPLAKGHPSPGLLAKLNIHISSLYSSARNSLKTASASSKSRSISTEGDIPSIDGDISPALLDYLKKESALAEIRSRKWLGVEAGESPGGEKVGLAIAWLRQAESMLGDLDRRGDIKGGNGGMMSKMKGLKLGSGPGGKIDKKERKGRTERESDEVEAFLKAYEKMNKTVSFQPIPPVSSLQSLLPSGRPVLQAKTYNPPAPAFGPALRGKEGGEVGGESGSRSGGGSGGGYAGAGSYF